MTSITSGNSIAVLIVEDLFPEGVKLEKYGSDAAVTLETLQMSETKMSVDGKISAGKIHVIKPITFTFAADSPSLAYFEQWINAQEQAREVIWCSLTISIPSTGRGYQFNKGVLQGGAAMPSINQTLGERQFTLHFENVKVAPIDFKNS